MPAVPGVVRLIAAGAAVVCGAAATDATPPDPFALLAPAVRLTASDRAQLDAGRPIARALPADDGHLGVFAAIRFDGPPEALIAWTRAIESLKRVTLVQAVGRFSETPVDADLAALTVDDHDLESLRRCRVGDCDVKLAASEIDAVTGAIRAAGPDWRAGATRAFKEALIQRVDTHRARGLGALPPYAARRTTASIHEAFAAIVARSPYLANGLPAIVPALELPLPDDVARDDAFYYWSKEHYGSGKPVISVTHVHWWSSEGGTTQPAAVSASTQLFASHYMNASLGVTMVLCSRAASPCYLAYVNRTHADVFGGLLGGLKRAIVRQRIESQGPGLITALRDRLQSAVPTS